MNSAISIKNKVLLNIFILALFTN